MLIKKNTKWLVAGRIICDAFQFVFYVVLARTFGEAGMGRYAFAFAGASVMALAVDFGMRPLITRGVARDEAQTRSYLGAIWMIQGSLIVVLFAGLLLVSPSIQGLSGDERFMLAAAFLGLALKSIGGGYIALLDGVERMDRSALLEVVLRGVTVVSGLSMIAAGMPLMWVMTAHVAGGLAQLALGAWWVRERFGVFKPGLDPTFAKVTLIAALPFFGAMALHVIYARIDVLMIRGFAGEAATGAYAVAYRCIDSALVLALTIGRVIYPAMSQTGEAADRRRREVFLGALRWLGLVGLLGTVTLVTVGDALLRLIFSDRYAESESLIRWMAPLLLIGAFRVPYWRLLAAVHREKLVLAIQCVAVGLHLIMNMLLVPRFGAMGAVWASVITEAISLVIYHTVCRSYFNTRHYGLAVVAAAVTAVVAAAGTAGRGVVPWPVLGVAVAAVWVGLMWPVTQRKP